MSRLCPLSCVKWKIRRIHPWGTGQNLPQKSMWAKDPSSNNQSHSICSKDNTCKSGGAKPSKRPNLSTSWNPGSKDLKKSSPPSSDEKYFKLISSKNFENSNWEDEDEVGALVRFTVIGRLMLITTITLYWQYPSEDGFKSRTSKNFVIIITLQKGAPDLESGCKTTIIFSNV